MVNYRRLISYIYAYEGSMKGKNIGFAKLESRNGQCRLNVNVKKVYAGGGDLGVYLLSSSQEIFLGNMFIHNGAGEFRAVLPLENISGSGCSMESCYGLSVHEKNEDWRVYKTTWEDAVTQAAELDLAEVTSQNMGDASEQIHRKLTELNQEIQAEEERLEEERAQIVQEAKREEDERKAETVKEIEAAETQKPAEERYENIPRESRKVGSGAQLLLQNINRVGNVLGILSQSQTSRNAGGGGSDFGGLEPGAAASPDRKDSALTVPESSASVSSPPDLPTPADDAPSSSASAAPGAIPKAPAVGDGTPASQPAPKPEIIQAPQEEEFLLGDPEALARLEREEHMSRPDLLWETFRKRYPKIQAFDSPGSIEILTIRPQDIGLLPRENWNYGNNSFLLHGYYNYRYLVFARVRDEARGRTRYIIGVPGHYYSNEKYMASMFGFPHFVLAKKQPVQNGRFGYWYADVRMENTD